MKIYKIAAIFIIALILTSCEKDKVLTYENYPSEIQAYVKTHFSDASIIQTTKEKDFLTSEYTVILSDMTRLEFNRKFDIQDIDSNTELPSSVVPGVIINYINNQFPDNFIKGWELEDKHQQISLNNGMDLEFKMDGTFMRIDD